MAAPQKKFIHPREERKRRKGGKKSLKSSAQSQHAPGLLDQKAVALYFSPGSPPFHLQSPIPLSSLYLDLLTLALSFLFMSERSLVVQPLQFITVL